MGWEEPIFLHCHTGLSVAILSSSLLVTVGGNRGVGSIRQGWEVASKRATVSGDEGQNWGVRDDKLNGNMEGCREG